MLLVRGEAQGSTSCWCLDSLRRVRLTVADVGLMHLLGVLVAETARAEVLFVLVASLVMNEAGDVSNGDVVVVGTARDEEEVNMMLAGGPVGDVEWEEATVLIPIDIHTYIVVALKATNLRQWCWKAETNPTELVKMLLVMGNSFWVD